MHTQAVSVRQIQVVYTIPMSRRLDQMQVGGPLATTILLGVRRAMLIGTLPGQTTAGLQSATIGEHVWKAEPGWFAGITDLHRRTFEIANGCTVLDARGALFSDNTSRWYINGTFVGQSEATASRQVALPAAVFHSGSNLLAVQVSNDHVSLINNPFGIQYILEVQTAVCWLYTRRPTSTPTSTPTRHADHVRLHPRRRTRRPIRRRTRRPIRRRTRQPTRRLTRQRNTPTNTPTPTSTNTPQPNPEIRLTKSPNPSIYTASGQVITYTYSVSNTGSVRLRGPVTVFDDKAIVTCPDVSTIGNGDSFLDPGESLTCSLPTS